MHLHLEHRVVQRLLGRFLSQGFVHDELSRACGCRTDDPKPRILVLGRLSLYGPSATRLHDKVLTVAADWSEPQARKKLTALPRADRDTALRDLKTALATPRLREVPAAVRTHLMQHAARDVADLLPQLETRARERILSAETGLKKRGDQESAALAAVIHAHVARLHGHFKDSLVESITKIGTVTYQAGSTTIRDDGKRLIVLPDTSSDALRDILQVAMKKYASHLAINGTKSFCLEIAEVAAQNQMHVTFDDKRLVQYRQQLMKQYKVSKAQSGERIRSTTSTPRRSL